MDAELSPIVAAVIAGVVALNLALTAWILLWVRRVRTAQRALLAGKNVDLVEFAVGMQTRMEHVEALVSEARSELGRAQRQIDGSVQRRALVRYDAIKDVGGNQSTSIALLDNGGTGVVISAIQGRDYARIYVKDVVTRAAASIALTPEEEQAVKRAMAEPQPS
ncbi:MAG: hypothetical protein AVDCRST_MAG79-838 [uncultured Thermoleophilia bacterium]|uniref:DUF4446 family protein n=1 Tax=uncultured Thermoleophilia bacterium TaxID=1497501 RepID=A0A6J4TQU2_9ACTN|nr:MAG: hypothetical protein AVDCRST_MAG79-838 [uncultured Thermoleophilia bacterium]